MYRLTEKDKQGNWRLKGVKWGQLRVGAIITEELWQKLYGALWKLMEYEDTGMNPDDVIRLNDFNQTSTCQMMKKLAEEKAKHRWILLEERLPDQDETVLVTVKRHRWVADYDCDWVPKSEKIVHKEVVYVTCGRLNRIRWEYMDFESGVWEEALYTNVLRGVLLSEPLTEIMAWQPLPESYEEGVKVDRLTHERSNGIKTGYWSPKKKDVLVERLAAYENTGLTPEEIERMVRDGFSKILGTILGESK